VENQGSFEIISIKNIENERCNTERESISVVGTCSQFDLKMGRDLEMVSEKKSEM